MDNPELYSGTNSVTKASAAQCLHEYSSKIKWKENGDSIIDLGCGDGSVTALLKKYVPKNYEKFFACDISETMVKFARETYDGENITFRVLDAGADDVPDDMKSGFNHVFSFYMLHWIKNQVNAFKNIYKLMNVGGDCLLTIVANNPINYLYDVIGKDQNMKWGSTWITDLSIFVSEYCHMKDPDKYIIEIMKKIGFVNIDVQCRRLKYTFENIVCLKRFVKSLEPYGMPGDVFEEFFKDFMAVGKRLGLFDGGITDYNDLKNVVPFAYNIIVIHAIKPNA